MHTCTHDWVFPVPPRATAVPDLRIVLPPLPFSDARKWDLQGGAETVRRNHD